MPNYDFTWLFFFNWPFLCLTYCSGEFHLGLKNEEINNKSWYAMLHPEDLTEARAKHIQCKPDFIHIHNDDSVSALHLTYPIPLERPRYTELNVLL